MIRRRRRMPLGYLVVCNGMYRSGSTLSYIVVQRLLERSRVYYRHFGAGAHEMRHFILRHRRRANWWVVKVHFYKPNRHEFSISSDRMRLIHTYRHPLDALASLQRHPEWKGRPAQERIDTICQEVDTYLHSKAVPTRCLMLRYESMMSDLNRMVSLIAGFLDIHVSPETIKQVAIEVNPRAIKSYTDTLAPGAVNHKTHLRHKHISDTVGRPDVWRDFISREDGMKVQSRCRAWMQEVGYKFYLPSEFKS